MDVIERPTLALDFRTAHLRYSDTFRALVADRPRHLRTDLTAERIRRLAKLAELTGRRDLESPTFDYGLAIVTKANLSRFELYSRTKDVKLSDQKRKAKIIESLEGIDAPGIEIIRTGIVSFGLGNTIIESGVITNLPASWEALVEIITPEFSERQFIPQI